MQSRGVPTGPGRPSKTQLYSSGSDTPCGCSRHLSQLWHGILDTPAGKKGILESLIVWLNHYKRTNNSFPTVMSFSFLKKKEIWIYDNHIFFFLKFQSDKLEFSWDNQRSAGVSQMLHLSPSLFKAFLNRTGILQIPISHTTTYLMSTMQVEKYVRTILSPNLSICCNPVGSFTVIVTFLYPLP